MPAQSVYPKTSVAELIEKLISAIRTVGTVEHKDVVPCTEVMLIKTIPSGTTAYTPDMTLVPALVVRVTFPATRYGQGKVQPAFADAVAGFGTMLVGGLSDFIQRPEVHGLLHGKGIDKIDVSYSRNVAKSQCRVQRASAAVNAPTVGIEKKRKTA